MKLIAIVDLPSAMSLKPAVLILSSLTGLAALTGILLGCQSQVPAPLPSPSVSASAPVKTVPNSTPPTQSSATETIPSQDSASPSDPQKPIDTPRSETVREVEKCTVNMAKVNDPNSPLNVRSTPNTDSDANIVGKLDNGDFVSVLEQKDGWFRISSPIAGWIAQSRTESTCNLKTERVQFGRGQTSATIDDRFIGGGTHQYRFNLAKGQRLSVVSNRGPLPAIIAPDGTELSGLRGEGQSWTGNLTASGDYILELESNYKGYQYSFTIAAE